jgi:glucose-1-phosphate thymidylyltransferase
MGVFTRVFRLIWGDDVERALRPLLAVSLTGSIAGSTIYPFLGIWAIKELHASQQALGLTYLVAAVGSGLVGYLGGHASDRVGRRPIMLLGWGATTLVPVGLLFVGDNVVAGLALLGVMPVFGSLGGAANQAMVADLASPERREAGYAAVRVASNLGVTIGPVLGGLFLLGENWNHLWLGVLPLAALSFAIAFRYIPRSGAYAPSGPPTRGSFRVIVHDHPFLLFMVSAVFATMTYIATETLLPISLATTHNLAPAAWGVLMIVNPLLVTIFQLRLTRWTADIPGAVKLGVAMPMMGLPFLLLNWNGSAPVIVLVMGADVPGGRRCSRARRHPRCVHGRVRQHLVGRVGSDPVPRAPGTQRLRRRHDVDVRRRPRRHSGDHRFPRCTRSRRPRGYSIARMKGLIAAGGTATRLDELTRVTNKHLLPVGRWPMVYYPLQLLQRAGVHEVLLVTGQQHAGQFIDLLGNGHVRSRNGDETLFDVDLSYKVQVEAGGIAQVVGMARDFAGDDQLVVCLGDNIFEHAHADAIKAWTKGALVFVKDVPDPENFGVVAYGDGGAVADIVEKAGRVDLRFDEPPSTDAVVGLYCYPPDVFEIIDGLAPSSRGELEITDVNRVYAQRGDLEVRRVDGWWHDGGKHWADLADVGRLIEQTGANK